MSSVTYWASEADGQVDGLLRMIVDDDAETVSMERFDPTASSWVDDPDALAETREVGVHEVSSAEAETIEPMLTDAAAAGDDTTGGTDGASAPVPGR